MTLEVLFIGILLLSSLPTFAQSQQATCPATEPAVREVEHRIWTAFQHRDVAVLEKLIDDDSINIDDGGGRKGKRELLAGLKSPEGNIHIESSEQPEDFRLVFINGVAILDFTRHWTDYEKQMEIDWGATVRITEIFACKNGEWRRAVFQETDMPNKNRKPSTSAIDHLDDYVGRYRFGKNGERGEFTVVRQGDTLSESWGGGPPTELLPGRYDTFFSREDGWVERFVRDQSGKVTGILYTHADGELEAKRVQ